MSYASAISSISQILDLQQQLLDPELAASATGTASGTSGTSTGDGTSTGSTSSTADSTFASELETALTQASEGNSSDSSLLDGTGTSSGGLLSSESALSSLVSLLESANAGGAAGTTAADGTAGTAGSTSAAITGSTTSAASGTSAAAKLSAMVGEANSLIGKPYVWGGGHSGWGAQSGYDCSGFVSAVLHAGGYLTSPQDTQTLAQASGIESGAGKYVTIYDRTDAGSGEDHVIIEINGQFYESGGEHNSWGGGGGVEKISTPSAAYLSTFNDILHPSGL